MVGCFPDEKLQAQVQQQATGHRAESRQGESKHRAPEPGSYTLCYKLSFDEILLLLLRTHSLSEN